MAAEGKSYGAFRVVPEEVMARLERAEKDSLQIVMNGSLQLRQAREEIAELRRALEWYAERANWRPRGLVPKVAAHEDRGARARKALGVP